MRGQNKKKKVEKAIGTTDGLIYEARKISEQGEDNRGSDSSRLKEERGSWGQART